MEEGGERGQLEQVREQAAAVWGEEAAAALATDVEAIRKGLSAKKTFVKATKQLSVLVAQAYLPAGKPGRDSLFGAAQRVATLLKSRYTSPLYWRAGCTVFMSAVRGRRAHLPRARHASCGCRTVSLTLAVHRLAWGAYWGISWGV